MLKVFLLAALLVPISSNAASISIIIDDIGYHRTNSFASTQLDPSVTLALLPDAPYSQEVAHIAKQKGMELILHLPMESMSTRSPREPRVLTMEQTEMEFRRTVRDMLQHFPGIRGVNNHQGSLLTRHPGHMHWLMEELLEHGGLYFVDSRTHKNTVAAQVSLEHGLETAERSFFLDANGDNPFSISQQARKIVEAAKTEEFLVVIAHPFNNSIKTLRILIRQLKRDGHDLVTTSQLILLMENRLYLAKCLGLDNKIYFDCFDQSANGG